MRRRATMYLTYWTAGDTRNRGREMLVFATAYRDAGVEPPRAEAPDHLPVVLEFAATVDPETGRRLLTRAPDPDRRVAGRPGRRQVALRAHRGSGLRDATGATDQEVRRAERLAQGRPARGSCWAATVYLDSSAPAHRRSADVVSPKLSSSSGTIVPYVVAGGRWRSALGGATATTSSAGPPVRRRSTSRGCCRSAARCSISAFWRFSLGHVMGLFVPPNRGLDAVGMSDHVYHLQAVLAWRRSPVSRRCSVSGC